MGTRFRLVLTAAVLAVGCRKPASDEVGATDTATTGDGADALDAAPDEGPLPALRTGTLEPIVDDVAVGKVVAHAQTKTHAFLEIELASGDARRAVVTGIPGAIAIPVDRSVIVRKPVAAPWPATVTGSLWSQRYEGRSQRWHRVPFESPSKSSGAPNEDLPGRFDRAFPFGDDFRRGTHPFVAFARGRLENLSRDQAKRAGVVLPETTRPANPTEFAALMGTITASISLQESLQHDRGLRARAGKEERTVPLAELSGPTLKRHPFEEMRKAIPDAQPVPEPLAEATPADFWYVRFDDIRLLLRTLDEADAWVTPVGQILQEVSADHELSARYQMQLGLRRTALARALGHTVVNKIAAVGSDPYLREGSDISIIFDVKQKEVFDSEIAGHLQHWSDTLGSMTETRTEYQGHTVLEHSDPSRRVRQQRADVGSKVILSNSPAAIRRILDAIDARAPRLSDQTDMKYLLARDPGEHDALAFLSDAFIERVIGPGQKIAEARRQLALADLLVPGYAALMHGWLHEAEPESVDALLQSGYLVQDDLTHADGAAITFAPGDPASSRYGTVAALTPLIDLGPVQKVSPRERDAYQGFARGYQRNWSTFVDPVAITLDIETTDGKDVATVGARILPLIEATDYDDVRDVVGDQRIQVRPAGAGVQAVWAVGADTRLRNQLDGMAKSFSPDGKLGIGWLGSWVAMGSLDRNAVLETTWFMFDEVQLPRERKSGADGEVDRKADDLELARRAGALPIYLMADVGNPVGLVATLSAIKGLATSVAPGMLDWKEHSKHGEIPIVRVGVSPQASDEDLRDVADLVAVYYAQAGGAIVLSLREDVVRGLIDRALADRLPEGTSKKADPQFVLEGAARRGGAMWTAAAWMLQAQAFRSSDRASDAAEILLRGAPTTQGDAARFEAVARAYFGSVPLTAAGTRQWALEPDGGGARGPTFGSAVRRTFVELPVAGSPLDRLMQRLTALRGEVAFDQEPGSQTPPAFSLRTSFRLTLAPEAAAP